MLSQTMSVSELKFWINSAFLSLYWVTFSIPGLLIKKDGIKNGQNLILTSNLFNFGFYLLLSLSQIDRVFPNYKFHFILSLGLIYLLFAYINNLRRVRNISLLNTCLGLALLTISVPFKTSGYNTTLIWTIELPLIVLVGFLSNKRAIRIFGLILAAVLLNKSLFKIADSWIFAGASLTFDNIVLLVSIACFGIAYGMYKYYRDKKLLNGEGYLAPFYAIASTMYLVLFVWKISPDAGLTLSFASLALALYFLGFFIREDTYQFVSLIVLIFVFFRVLFNIDERYFSDLGLFFVHLIAISVFFIIYFLQRTLKSKYKFTDYAWNSLMILGAFVFMFMLFTDLPSDFISLSWGTLAIIALITAVTLKDNFLRIIASILFLPLFIRLVFVEETFFSNSLQFVTYLVLIGLFFAAYLLSNTSASGSKKLSHYCF